MPCRNGTADPVKPEFVIDTLEEEVAAVEAVLLVHGKVGTGAQFNVEFGGILFFRLVHQADLFLCPGFGIGNAVGLTDEFFGTETFDNEGFVFPVYIYGFLYIV